MERKKEPRCLCRIEPDAIVRDGDLRRGSVAQRDVHGSAIALLTNGVDRIAQQVLHSAAEQNAIALDRYDWSIDFKRNIRCDVVELLNLFINQAAKVDSLRIELNGPGEGEEALDRLQQEARLFFGALQAPFGDVIDCAAPSELHVAEDRGQRAAELVGDAGGNLAELGERGHLLDAHFEAADRR